MMFSYNWIIRFWDIYNHTENAIKTVSWNCESITKDGKKARLQVIEDVLCNTNWKVYDH